MFCAYQFNFAVLGEPILNEVTLTRTEGGRFVTNYVGMDCILVFVVGNQFETFCNILHAIIVPPA